jgi:DNA-binding MarR family transcriptional regulator
LHDAYCLPARMKPESPQLKVFQGLLTFFLERRKVYQAFPQAIRAQNPLLGIVEESVLGALSTHHELSIRVLTEMIHVDQSWMSRVANRLTSKGLTSASSSKYDKRLKLLTLTALGQKTLRSHDKITTLIFDKTLDALSHAQVNRFSYLLSLMADNLDSNDYGRPEGRHPVDQALLRISWKAGMLNDSFLGSDLSFLETLILQHIFDRRHQELSLTSIAAEFPYDTSTTSRTITNLESRGCIKKLANEKDRRGSQILLTAKGEKTQNEMQESEIELVRRGLKNARPEVVEELESLLAAIINSSALLKAAPLPPPPSSEYYERARDLLKTDNISLHAIGKINQKYQGFIAITRSQPNCSFACVLQGISSAQVEEEVSSALKGLFHKE